MIPYCPGPHDELSVRPWLGQSIPFFFNLPRYKVNMPIIYFNR
ncbi:unnamed protein product, partial [Staurois parvus]